MSYNSLSRNNVEKSEVSREGLSHCGKSVQKRIFFWSVFSQIQTEYGDLLRKSPYLDWIRENTD